MILAAKTWKILKVEKSLQKACRNLQSRVMNIFKFHISKILELFPPGKMSRKFFDGKDVFALQKRSEVFQNNSVEKARLYLQNNVRNT